MKIVIPAKAGNHPSIWHFAEFLNSFPPSREGQNFVLVIIRIAALLGDTNNYI